MVKIGVLSLQGDFEEHLRVLDKLGLEGVEVRKCEDLLGVEGLILPGGESTTISKLLDSTGLRGLIETRVASGLKLMGTCAGLILLSRSVRGDGRVKTFGFLDITVERNAYGSQVHSFYGPVRFVWKGKEEVRKSVFIRAPKILSVGEGVEVLAFGPGGEVVMVRNDFALGLTFHPELTDDTEVHEYFVEMIRSG
jgi:5'-phosphate synthase pdxT subunit